MAVEDYNDKDFTPQYGILEQLGLWNSNIAPSIENAVAKGKGLIEAIKDAADNYPTFKSILKQEGFLNADGSINYQKMIDRGFINTIKQSIKETGTQSKQNLLKQAKLQALLNKSALPSLAKQFSDIDRNNFYNLYNTLKSEKENAYSKTMGLSNIYQQDLLNKLQSGVNAKRAAYDFAREISSQQTPGFMQSPEKWAPIIAEVMSDMFKNNPLGLLSLFGNKQSEEETKNKKKSTELGRYSLTSSDNNQIDTINIK